MIKSSSIHWFNAIVESNNDPDVQGKVQVRLLPDFKDVDSSLLPWVLPFHTQGMSKESFSFHPPQVNDEVWVIYLDVPFFREGYYFTGQFLRGFFSYGTVKNVLSAVTELSDSTYPKLAFELFPNGNVVFHHLVNGDIGVYHKSGTYTIIDQNGNVKMNSVGAITLTAGSSSIVMNQSGEVDINGGNLKVLA